MIHKKRAGSKSFRASSASLALLQISSDNSCDGTDGGASTGAGGNRGARCSSRSTDRVGSTGTGNSCIRNQDSHNSCIDKPDNQPQCRLKLARQNAAQERKSIHPPSMQLTEVFSLYYSLLCLLSCKEAKAPFRGFPGRQLRICVTLYMVQ